jgi:hypothetical protein
MSIGRTARNRWARPLALSARMEKPERRTHQPLGAKAAVSTSFETPVDQSMTAALVSALEDLTSAVSSQSESLDGLGAGPDQRISGDSVLFSRVPPLRVVVSVVLEEDLYAELEASGHPATDRENRGTRTLSDVLIEDEGRGWLRIYEPSTTDSFSKTSWNLLIPLGRIEAVTSSSTTPAS